MDTTIRNLDPAAYRALKARAALAGKGIGELLNEAIRTYLRRPQSPERAGSLHSLPQSPFAAGSEQSSEEVDAIVYGIHR